jgi:hypothetical protein
MSMIIYGRKQIRILSLKATYNFLLMSANLQFSGVQRP